ncbi:hypothetical protein AVEN_54675-1 [Araneus ventricosus]|uniref:Uncharacterized protein n=1 Tax=Araneus ventricosus TaxID=182803 RepID=A0A4Y2BLF6_ARAVE|nr:hypothetical protein AVEN_54675-1 [Araneus ventricosus]
MTRYYPEKITLAANVHAIWGIVQSWKICFRLFSQIAKKACLKGFGNLVVSKGKGLSQKVSMTRVEPFGKKVVKSPPSGEKIGHPPKPHSYKEEPPFSPLFKAVFLQTSNSSEPGIEPEFLELEGKRNTRYTGLSYTRWDRWFMKILSTSILREWLPKRFERKCFHGLVVQTLSVR